MAEPPDDQPVPERQPGLEDALNTSLGDVLDLLANQVAHLKLSLELLRQTPDATDRDARIRWHVQQIDLRQDRMDQIKAMILARGQSELH